jgi:hypothetical protein
MTRIEVIRHVTADPAGVALLLAEPAMWSDPIQLDHTWVVAPPHRAMDGFASTVEVTEPWGRLVTGELTVTPALDTGCEIRLVIRVPDRSVARGVERSGVGFLALLAERAQARAFAA